MAIEIGFRVNIEGADLAHRWLKVTDELLRLPTARHDHNEMPVMQLGELDIHNTLIHQISSRLYYSPEGSYEFGTHIIPHPGRSSMRSMLSGRGLRGQMGDPRQALRSIFGDGVAIEVDGLAMGMGIHAICQSSPKS